MKKPKISENQLVFFTDYQCLRFMSTDQDGDPNFEKVDSFATKKPIVGMPAADPTEKPKYVIGNIKNQLQDIFKELDAWGDYGEDIALVLEKIERLEKIMGK